MSRWLAVISRRPYAFPLLVYDYLKAGFKRAWRTLEYTLQDPIEKHLPSVHVPTLVIRGSMDAISPQRWAEEVTNLLPKEHPMMSSMMLPKSCPVRYIPFSSITCQRRNHEQWHMSLWFSHDLLANAV